MRELHPLGGMPDSSFVTDYDRRLTERASWNHTIQQAIKEARAQKRENIIPFPTITNNNFEQPSTEPKSTFPIPLPMTILHRLSSAFKVFGNHQPTKEQAIEQVAQIEDRIYNRTQEEIEALQIASEHFRNLLDRTEEILEGTEPQKWFRSVARYVIQLDRQVRRHPETFPPAVRKFLEEQVIPNAKAALKRQLTEDHKDLSADEIALIGMDIIHEICEAVPYPEATPAEMKFISTDEIIDMSNGRIKQEKRADEYGLMRTYLSIYSQTRNTWYEFPLPTTENIMHKGGIGRVILKVISGAPNDLIETELPPNDFDLVAYGDSQQVYEEAARMGVETEGVEFMRDKDELPQLLIRRDIDLNQAFVGKDGIVFTDEAWHAAKTGEIDVCTAPRKLYGENVTYYKGKTLINARTQLRYIKFVAEGKATSFEFLPMNTNIDFGIFSLVLARKFMSKPNGPELLNRMAYLLTEMGVIQEGETIFDVLDRAHEKYPFFNFNENQLDQVGVLKWLNSKLTMHLHRSFRYTYKVPSRFDMPRSEGDNIPKTISLEGYQSTEEQLAQIQSGWNKFLERAATRSESFDQLSPAEKREVRKNAAREKEKYHSLLDEEQVAA